MYDKTLLKDSFGRCYILQNRMHSRIKGALKPKVFPDHHLARQFIQGLQAPPGYWQWLMQECGMDGSSMPCEVDHIGPISDHVVNGRLYAFEINPPTASSNAPQKRAIKARDRVVHFVPAVEQLLHNTDARHFNSPAEAEAFLQGLNPDAGKLRDIATALNLPLPVTAGTDPAELSQALAKSMVTGDTAVMVDVIASATPPAPLEVVMAASMAGNRKADLGPHETEEAPKHWFAVQLVNEVDESYKKETFTVNLSDKSSTTVNGGNPDYRKEQLPAGTCGITFDGFYQPIEQWLGERSQ